MRKLCPNFDKENGLDTVLEVPIPEEMFTSMGSNAVLRWQNLRSLMKAQSIDNINKLPSSNNNDNNDKSHLSSGSNNEFMALLKLVGSPLIPLQLQSGNVLLTRPIKTGSIETSSAKYILQQYLAATGGLGALNSINSMYAVGQVKMRGSEMKEGDDSVVSVKTKGKQGHEVGGFVLWQMNPDLWYLELVVSGFKVSAGSDGKLAWNQSSSQPSHANKGPPRPLRRFFQGLDPRCIANLFLEGVCVGEKTIKNDDCFVLRLETAPNILKAQSTAQTEISRHTMWGYFSQRTGLLIQFEDTKLVRMKPMKGKNNKESSSVFWETTMISSIEDYRYEDGINIAHSGNTSAMLYRYGEAHNHKRRIEETWKIEEIGFNISGLSMDCFLPPSELKRDNNVADT
ncbi:uncharacterized protein LOC115700631 [Cannabis sativa]|uniref:DUF620 domain-containing protein n=1 Tax=Cannabis sativa TaxID=3483 RepID=A0A7J6DNU2_CANSA|nr:uncharacterized protein LOC115700631 [Cannabis sativa]KAF4347279.1 hypothetical protein G4B88_012846 [Cannabis sativa]KAF4357295.1 hypothetical protein F8388_002803 [Cannabis sativa]KAF4359023.1 hypothetical protein F8388_015070 [Cannabis sativa]